MGYQRLYICIGYQPFPYLHRVSCRSLVRWGTLSQQHLEPLVQLGKHERFYSFVSVG